MSSINTLKPTSSQYPDLLREIASPPRQLYVLGQLTDTPAVAIVGSRRPTDYGRQVTYQLAGELARAGLVIVSGLALGIDAVAHQAALEAGGVTWAVMAGGLDNIYPPSNRALGRKILESGGAIMSEYPAGTTYFPSNFPARNRLIAGLSLAVIVTEADAKSGALITANFAINQNRQVMAVPGHITSLRSAGPNNLLKKGAVVVTDSSDILAALDLTSEAIKVRPARASSKNEAKILDLLRSGVNSTQDLIESSGFSAQEFANIISLMEITGKVRNLGAGNWVAK